MSDKLQVVCPHCHTVIRVPVDRLADQPKCAKCHQPLFTAHPVELTTAVFDRHLKNSDIPLVVDFWAPWCGPCLMMAPAYEKAAGMLEPHYRLAKVNTEAEPALAVRFGIRSIPTMIAFRSGQEVGRQSGAVSAEQIVKWVRANAGSPTQRAAQA